MHKILIAFCTPEDIFRPIKCSIILDRRGGSKMRPYVTLLITLLLLLQNVQVFMCRQLAHKRQSEGTSAEEMGSEKRTISGAGAGQSEELLRAGDQIESNYDEYPMVVPKRAALLLDRLMVALHRALEKERSGQTNIIDLYANKNGDKDRMKPKNTSLDKHSRMDEVEQDPNYAMYSDDDPSVIMDYDFKDLNSINRATGETLMAKSFQRRALGLDVGGGGGAAGVAMLTAARDELGPGGSLAATSGGVSGRNNVGNSGRLYWRCYFNASSDGTLRMEYLNNILNN